MVFLVLVFLPASGKLTLCVKHSIARKIFAHLTQYESKCLPLAIDMLTSPSLHLQQCTLTI